MKTLTENLDNNLVVLNEIEMSKILGGNCNCTSVEDEEVWM
jgi:hypothetical protein